MSDYSERPAAARIPAPSRSGFTSSTTLPLYWCSYGEASSAPAVVLHGGPGAHHDYLLPQFLILAQNQRLLFYDQRGGGRSKTETADPITWRTHVEDLAAVVQEFEARPLTLIGYSWGALLALLYTREAVQHGVFIPPVRLVLVDPAPVSIRYRREFEEEFARRQRGPEISRLREELAESGLRERNPDAYRQRQFELSVAGYFADPRRARDLTPFRVTGRVQQSVWESLGDYDLLPSLESLQVPTLIVHGRWDPIPLESSEQAARAMRARFLVLEASGHVPYVEQPDALFSTVAQFLEDTQGFAG
ncbi:MAG: alpha/beta fold hydrolase [Gemmatimonadaceae bacterium]